MEEKDLIDLVIPDGTKEILRIREFLPDGEEDKNRIRSVAIPDSVTSIGIKAFECCDKLTIACSEGSYAEQYAKRNNINVTIVPKSEQVAVKPDESAKTAKKKSCHL